MKPLPHPPAHIRYTQTRVAQADPAALREQRVFTGLDGDARADVFRRLRADVLRPLRAQGWNSLAVTSPGAGAGKTFVALNLAIALALEAHQSVLLIDADFRRPQVAQRLGLPAGPGLADCLEEGVPLDAALVNPGLERLVVLPGRPVQDRASELAASPQMVALAREAKARYAARLIVFDLPPLSVADDALSLLSLADAALLVVEDQADRPEQVQAALRALEHVNLLGLVLNKSK
jgi:protein-tyrosine kinase